LQEHRLEDKRLASRAELDSVSQRHPIAVRYGYHVTVLNTCALKAAGIHRGTPDPPDATVVRDATGEPTGLVREFYAYLPIPEYPSSVLKGALRRVIEGEFLSRGVTSVYEITDSLDAVRALAELRRDGENPLRVAAYVNVPTTVGVETLLEGEAFDEVERRGIECLGLKLFADGAGQEAALHEPYADMPDYRGKLNFTDRELAELVRKAHALGRQVAVHAEGDRAQDQVLDVYERVLAERPRPDHRHRIEHMGNLFGTRRRLERAAAMGALPVPNPGFIHAFADFEEDLFGPERTRRMYNLADLKRLGLPVPGNSDCAGAHPETINPLNSVWCAVNRRTYSGKRLDPDQALPVTDALRMVTIDAAYAGHQETGKGYIEPGKLADLVVLSAKIRCGWSPRG
jgi:predicted amidohydrolase YtcJ